VNFCLRRKERTKQQRRNPYQYTPRTRSIKAGPMWLRDRNAILFVPLLFVVFGLILFRRTPLSWILVYRASSLMMRGSSWKARHGMLPEESLSDADGYWHVAFHTFSRLFDMMCSTAPPDPARPRLSPVSRETLVWIFISCHSLEPDSMTLH
jgi:hypothetical protein